MSIPITEPAPRKFAGFFAHDYVIAALIAVGLSILTFVVATAFGWITGAPNWFEFSAAALNYGATYLSIKQRRFTYALGFAASALWAVAFFQYGLIASSILSLYLVGQLVYGYFRWGPDQAARPVHKFQWKYLWAYALATAVTYGGAVLISTAFGGTFAFWDAAILIATIWAQFMLDNKVLGTWYVWMLVNIIGVTLYATTGAPFAAMQQFIFGLANIWGWYEWRKSMQNSASNFSEEAISENQPKENSELSFTEAAVVEEHVDRKEKVREYWTSGPGSEPLSAPLPPGRYTVYAGDSKVEAALYDPTPTQELDKQ